MIDIIAIDPGSVGGIVNLCVTNNGIVTAEAEALAKLTRRELIDWCFDRATPVTRGLIEKVAPQPAFDPKTKQRRSMGAKSAFTSYLFPAGHEWPDSMRTYAFDDWLCGVLK